ncbi:MAG: thioredoxin domain-containing protein, partial [Planctomycetota bacterium]
EKMLYDNALLATVYLEAFLATGDANYQRVARETLDYVLRDMTDPAGGFYSTEDADSPPHDLLGVGPAGEPGGPNEEGLFYTWKPEEVRKVLGGRSDDDGLAEQFCRVYDVTPLGNFEGRSILNLPKTPAQQAAVLGAEAGALGEQLAASRAKLLAARDSRPRPGRDDKVLAAWNGLMIDAMARAGAALGEPRYVEAARGAADFILGSMRDGSGRLLHTWRGGAATLDAYLDDYAAVANGLVSLYEATLLTEPDERYLDAAAELLDAVLARFADAERGGFFYTADDHEALITRNRDLTDNATPGGNSLAATALVRLGKLTGRADYLDAAHGILRAASPLLERMPMATGQMLIALDLWLGPTRELLLVGDDGTAAAAIHRRFLPRRVVASRHSSAAEGRSKLLDAAFAGKDAAADVSTADGSKADGSKADGATLFACQDHACGEPATGGAIADAIAKL